MEITGQGTVNYDQLTGESFYLVKSTFEKEFALIDSLVEIGESVHLSEAMGLVSTILNSQPENQKALLEQGDIYIELKDYNKALNAYNKAIKLYPNDPKCFNYRGYMYLYNTKEYEKAIADFNQCIEIDSAYTNSYGNRANVYLELEDYKKALADFTSAIDLDKDNARRYEYRAECYIVMEDYTSALKDLDRAIDLVPEDPSYYNNRADFLETQERYDEALKDYATVIEISTDDWQTVRAINNRALIYETQKNYELAIEEYTKGLLIHIENHLLLFENRAELYLELEDYANALIDYNHLVDNDPQNVQYLLDRAACLEEMQKFNLAINDLNKVLRIDSLSDDAYYERSFINWIELERPDLGILDMSNAIKINPTEPLYFTFRARMFQDLDSLGLVLPDLTKAIELDSNDAYTWFVRGGFYKSIGDVDNAIKDNLEAIEVDSLYDFAYEDVIELYLELEDIDNAEYFHSRLITLFPDNSLYYNNRGFFYKNQKEEAGLALADFVTAIEIATASNDNWQIMRAINGKAILFEEREEFKLAIDEYTIAISTEESPILYENRAAVYQKLKDYNNAIADFTQSIELDKENPVRYELRADCYVEMEDYTNALLDLSKAIDLSPEDPYFYTYRADFYCNYLENSTKALEDYDNAIKLAPNYKWPLNNKALIFLKQEKYDQALEIYDLIISFDSTYWTAHYNKADIFQLQEKYTEELYSRDIVISYNLENPDRYTERAECYLAMEDDTNAIKDYEKAIELAPDVRMYFYNRAKFYHQKKEYDLALKDYTSAIETEQSLAYKMSIYCERAFCYVDAEDYENANNDFNQVIKLDPENTSPYFYRAKMYHKLSESENEKKDYLRAIELNDEDPEGYYYLADFYLKQNKILHTINYYTKSIIKLSANLGYSITSENGIDKIELTDVYLKRGEVYKNADAIDLMCEDYKNACDLGDCEMFNHNCK